MAGEKCVHGKGTESRCKNWPLKGGVVCRSHGGNAPQVKAKAAVRAELMSWGLDAPTVDPGETLLKLVSQSAARAEGYALELKELAAERPTLRDALIREAYGEFGTVVGEYARGLVALEAQERERCANWCVKAIAAGLAERTVRLAERQGALIADLLRAVMNDPQLGLTPAQRRVLPDVAERHLDLVC